MTKEEFIENYSNINYYIAIVGYENYERVVNILNSLNIQSSNIKENNIYKIYLNLDRDAVDEHSVIQFSIFINDWLSVSESKNENIKYVIDEYLKENKFNFIENSYTIVNLNSLVDILNADWINLKTTMKYSIYWNNFNKDLIITIINYGSFKIKF